MKVLSAVGTIGLKPFPLREEVLQKLFPIAREKKVEPGDLWRVWLYLKIFQHHSIGTHNYVVLMNSERNQSCLFHSKSSFPHFDWVFVLKETASYCKIQNPPFSSISWHQKNVWSSWISSRNKKPRDRLKGRIFWKRYVLWKWLCIPWCLGNQTCHHHSVCVSFQLESTLLLSLQQIQWCKSNCSIWIQLCLASSEEMLRSTCKCGGRQFLTKLLLHGDAGTLKRLQILLCCSFVNIYHRVCFPILSAFWLVATDAFLSLSQLLCSSQWLKKSRHVAAPGTQFIRSNQWELINGFQFIC